MKRYWFLPETPDVLGTLHEQAAVTLTGLQALAAWAGGEPERQSEVRAAEHTADDIRRRLAQQVRTAFSTPVDQEDLYSLSERLDAVLNMAKNIVREAEAFDLAPDQVMADLARLAVESAEHLIVAVEHLTRDRDLATTQADAAIAVERAMEKRYRTAMPELLKLKDLAVVMGRRELYHRLLALGELEVAVAERVWYAVVKEA